MIVRRRKNMENYKASGRYEKEQARKIDARKRDKDVETRG